MEFLFSEPSVRDASSLVSVRVGGNSHAQRKILESIRSSNLFEDVAGENEETFANYNDGSNTHRVFGIVVTKNYFTALGVPVLYGRGVLPSDPDEVVVLRYQFWRKYFDGDPSVVGRTIKLDGRFCTVLGITTGYHRTPLGFGYSPDVYIPVWREDTVLAMYARLKPGVSIGEARAGLATVAARIDATTPGEHPYARGIRGLSAGRHGATPGRERHADDRRVFYDAPRGCHAGSVDRLLKRGQPPAGPGFDAPQ